MGYNIQTAVDEMSKMFIAIVVSQKADDHDQFPSIINKAIENMKENQAILVLMQDTIHVEH